jgi:hypothetical protein
MLDFVLCFFPMMQLHARWLDHAFLRLTEGQELQTRRLINHDGPIWFTGPQSILSLLDGGDIQEDSRVVLSTWRVLAHFWNILLLGLSNGP